MRCPYCGNPDTQVKDSRPSEDNTAIRRRRVCPDCGGRFTTFERVQLRELTVVKRNGRRVPFDRDKLMRSVQVAVRKRSVDPDRVERMVNGIVRQLESSGESDVPSETIGATGDGGAARPRRGRLCTLRLGLSKLQGCRRFQDGARRAFRRTGDRGQEVRVAMSAARAKPLAPRIDAEFDRRMMAAALRLGRRNLGQTSPNPAVGCIIVRTDGDTPVVVGRGWTAVGGRPHAEKEALKDAGAAAEGATVYVTLEPCAHKGRAKPCSEALVEAKVGRVVSAMVDPDPRTQGKGHAVLEAAGIPVTVGCSPTKRRAPIPATSSGSPRGGRMSRSNSRCPPTA